MAYNKFIKQDGTILLDLTGDTATESLVGKGVVFHKPDGTQAIGTCEFGGGKEPVLTELTVTENGVYDEPMIGGGLEPIIWDGVVGDRVSADAGDLKDYYVKVSDMILSVDAYVGSLITLSNGNTLSLSSDFIVEMPDGIILAGEYVLTVPEANFVTNFSGALPYDVIFPEAGVYFGNAPEFDLVVTSLAFPSTPSAPADGWNKVTVNVAGDIVDVSELPTENIDEGKIYRVKKESEPEIWMYESSQGVLSLDSVLSQFNTVPHVSIYVVDTLPEVMEPSDLATSIHCYVLESTGVAYVNQVIGNGASTIVKTFGQYFGMGMQDAGWADSIDNIPGDYVCSAGTYYAFVVRGKSSTTYGIPDEANNKTVMEHNGSEWVECGSLTGIIPVIDVLELPTENINENALYRVKSADFLSLKSNGETERFVERLQSLGVSCSVSVVETLPEPPVISSMDKMLCYVLAETGVGYTALDNTGYKTFASILGYTDYGWIEDESMVVEKNTVYTLPMYTKYMYSDGAEIPVVYNPPCNYVLNDDGNSYTAVGNEKYFGEVFIEAQHRGLPVIGIGSFKSCEGITTVVVPSTVDSVADGAFHSCYALRNVVFIWEKYISVFAELRKFESENIGVALYDFL